MNDGERLLLLPTLAAFVRAVARDLCSGTSVLVLLPAHLDATLLHNLCVGELYKLECCVVRQAPVAGTAARNPLRALSAALFGGSPPRHFASSHALAAAPDVQGVIALNGLHCVERSARTHWHEFMAEWAEAARSLAGEPDRVPAALFACHCVEPGEEPPPTSPFLRTSWAWGLTSALDIRIVVRSLHDEPGGRLDAQAAWRESVIPPLAGGDLRLGRALWDVVLKAHEEIIAALKDYARACNWTVTGLRKLGMDDVLRRRLPGRLFSGRPRAGPERDLWAAGALDFTPEEGVAVSSAALALLGEEEALRHRLWQGQAALVLPEIDRIRVEACRRLTGAYGTLWITQWADLPPDEQADLLNEPLSAEWGHIRRGIRGAPDNQSALLRMIHEAHSLRNQLAHYAPITFDQYLTLRTANY